MTSDELGNMTVAEVEHLARRLSKAARTIRGAQELLGGGPKRREPDAEEEPAQPRPVAPPDAIAAHRLRQLQPPEVAPGAKSQLNPAEQAAKRGLMNQFQAVAVDDPNLPEEIRAMERGE